MMYSLREMETDQAVDPLWTKNVEEMLDSSHLYIESKAQRVFV